MQAKDGSVEGVGEKQRGNQRSLMGENGGFKDVEKDEEKGLMKKNSCNIVQNVNSDDSSSSIGRDSDASMEKSGDGEEVQSSFKGTTFDAAMEALEEVLPIRRGISRFYNGRSNSFACLSDASSSPARGLAKPDNAFKRRRRNLLACSLSWDKNRCPSPGSNGGGISKRVTPSSRAMAMNKMGNVVVMDQC